MTLAASSMVSSLWCRVGWYWKYHTAIIATKSLWLLPWYCIAIIDRSRAQHHYTYVPLETAIASLYIGMNLWILIVVVGTNLICTLYCSIVMCNVWEYFATYWQYCVLYCTCLLKHENVCDTDITSPNITRWQYYWNIPNPTLVNVDIGHARDQKVAKWIGTGLSPPETSEVVGVTLVKGINWNGDYASFRYTTIQSSCLMKSHSVDYASFRHTFTIQSSCLMKSHSAEIPPILKWGDSTYWFRYFRLITGSHLTILFGD